LEESHTLGLAGPTEEERAILDREADEFEKNSQAGADWAEVEAMIKSKLCLPDSIAAVSIQERRFPYKIFYRIKEGKVIVFRVLPSANIPIGCQPSRDCTVMQSRSEERAYAFPPKET
jgi:hypothetical protein